MVGYVFVKTNETPESHGVNRRKRYGSLWDAFRNGTGFNLLMFEIGTPSYVGDVLLEKAIRRDILKVLLVRLIEVNQGSRDVALLQALLGDLLRYFQIDDKSEERRVVRVLDLIDHITQYPLPLAKSSADSWQIIGTTFEEVLNPLIDDAIRVGWL